MLQWVHATGRRPGTTSAGCWAACGTASPLVRLLRRGWARIGDRFCEAGVEEVSCMTQLAGRAYAHLVSQCRGGSCSRRPTLEGGVGPRATAFPRSPLADMVR